MSKNPQRKSVSRRKFLEVAGLGTASMLALSACGDTPTNTAAPSATTAATSATTAASSATTAAPGATTAVAGATTAAGGTISAPAVINMQGKSIKVAILGDQNATALRQPMIAPFLAKYPGANVELMPVPSATWDEFFNKLLAMKAAGNMPDVINVATEGAQLFASKQLTEPLDEFVKRDKAELTNYFSDVHPALVEAMMYEGSLYSLPANWNGANLYYNTKLLGEAGFSSVDPNWTKDQFYEIAKKVTKKDTVYGYQWVNRVWGSWSSWMFTNNSNLLVEEKAPGGDWLWSSFYGSDPAAKGRGGGWRWTAPKANDAANVEALDFMVQLYSEGVSPSIELGAGTTLQGIFSAGKIAMTQAGGFWVATLAAQGMAKGSYDVALMPKWKSQRHHFGTAGYMVSKDSKNKDLGWEFVKFTSTVEAMNVDKSVAENRNTPVRRSMMTEARYAANGPKNWKVFYDTLDKYPDTGPIPAPGAYLQMSSIFTKHTGLAMSKEQPVKTALDNMQKELEPLFKK
jgi:multiple sugar transport system substrate-binding protein